MIPARLQCYVVFLVWFLAVYAIVETEYGTGCDRVWLSG